MAAAPHQANLGERDELGEQRELQAWLQVGAECAKTFWFIHSLVHSAYCLDGLVSNTYR